MGGTYEGGVKASETNKRKYGPDFYKRIGSYGGQSTKKDGTIKGFALMKQNGELEKVREAGRKGGRLGKRGPKLPDPKPSITNRIRSFIDGV